MNNCRPRIAGVLIGNIHKDPAAKTKYGYFFEALGQQFPLVEVYDATLHGRHRYLNALFAFHPNPQRWRESFYKNVAAFRLRSQQVGVYFSRRRQQVDLMVQVGVLFNARWHAQSPPSVIYTDYTAYLAAQTVDAGRSPFSPRERQEWLALERAAFQGASHICTRSKLVRQSIIRDYGIRPECVTVIGGGVNFAPLPQPVLHNSAHDPIALFIGKELYRKGGDILLEAFARARQVVPEARLMLLTTGPIPGHLPRQGVEFIAPTWDRRMIAQLYGRADFFVLPSRLETWGDVLLEAMSYGLPCIGVAGQAMEEIIQHRLTGLIVPPEDIEALGLALIRLFTDTELRARLGRQARLQAEAQYQWQDVVRRLQCCIQEMVVYRGTA